MQRSRRHVICGGAARRSYGQWAVGTSSGTLRTFRWRVAAHLRGPAVRQEVRDLQAFLRWRDPDLNRGHHDFQTSLIDRWRWESPARRQGQLKSPPSANLANSVLPPSVSSTRRGPWPELRMPATDWATASLRVLPMCPWRGTRAARAARRPRASHGFRSRGACTPPPRTPPLSPAGHRRGRVGRDTPRAPDTPLRRR